MSDKRTQLLEAAIDLFSAEGFWNTPTAKIAKHANVGTGTLFNYFPTKDALIDAVYLQLKREWTAHLLADYPINGTVQERCEHIWFRYIDWSLKNQRRYTLMHQLRLSNLVSCEAQERQQSDLAFAMATLQDGFREGLFVEISADYLATLIIAQIEAAISYASAHQLKEMALTKHIAQGFHLLWKSITK